MDVIDASDFSHLTVIGSWATADPSGRPNDLAVDGDRVWIADRTLGLHLVDLSTPTAPASLDLQPEREDQAWCVGCAGGLMALGLISEGVRLCRAESDQIEVLATCTKPHPAPSEYLATADGLVVTADESRTVMLFSPQTAGDPLGQIGFEHPYFARIDGFDADGNLALLAARLDGYPHTRMYVFDISEPADPVIVYSGPGLPALPLGTGEVAMDGHLAFVDCDGIYAYDLSNPTDPQIAGLYGFSHHTFGVELLEQNALCTWDPEAGGLVVVDRKDTWDMEVLEILPVPAVPTAMVAAGDRLYAATWPGIWVFDVSTPGESQHLGNVAIDGYVHGLATSGDGVWVSLGSDGLQLWNLDDPQEPFLRATLTGQGRIDGVATVGEATLANAPDRGLLWLTLAPTPVPAAAEPLVLRQNVPNPFNPQTEIAFTLASPGPARVEIFDVRGQRVRLLAEGILQEGAHRLIWDGRNASGRPVASGTYIYHVVTEEGRMSRKMTLGR
jgi:hypothetical protein